MKKQNPRQTLKLNTRACGKTHSSAMAAMASRRTLSTAARAVKCEAAASMNWNYPTAVRFGAGRVGELKSACEELGIHKPLLVTVRSPPRRPRLRSWPSERVPPRRRTPGS